MVEPAPGKAPMMKPITVPLDIAQVDSRISRKVATNLNTKL